jgi:transposase
MWPRPGPRKAVPQSRTLPAGDVFRTRLIMALAEGKSYREIERSLQTSAATIARWSTRFQQDGLAGLEGRHKGSRPRTVTAAIQARVVRRVRQKPNDGSSHWSCRKLAQELGLSKSTVQRAIEAVPDPADPAPESQSFQNTAACCGGSKYISMM